MSGVVRSLCEVTENITTYLLSHRERIGLFRGRNYCRSDRKHPDRRWLVMGNHTASMGAWDWHSASDNHNSALDPGGSLHGLDGA